jgi:tRNA(Arg) A34 adenosine deaminase TadA
MGDLMMRRRCALRWVAAALGTLVAARTTRSIAAAAPATPQHITQPSSSTPQAFMDRAFDMRRQAGEAGDQSFGAVIVKDGRIVGLGPSRVVTGRDPTAHAEMEAIRDAARRLGTRDLSGCLMFSTSPPCRMCETAAYWANVSRLYHGQTISDGGAPRYGGC